MDERQLNWIVQTNPPTENYYKMLNQIYFKTLAQQRGNKQETTKRQIDNRTSKLNEHRIRLGEHLLIPATTYDLNIFARWGK